MKRKRNEAKLMLSEKGFSIYYLGGKNLSSCNETVFIGLKMNTYQLQIHE